MVHLAFSLFNLYLSSINYRILGCQVGAKKLLCFCSGGLFAIECETQDDRICPGSYKPTLQHFLIVAGG